MLLKEKFETEGLFSEIQSLFAPNFLANIEPETLDLFLVARYGEREILSAMEKMSTENIAKYVYGIFSAKWENLFNVLAVKDEESFTGGYKEVYEETSTLNGAVTSNGVNTDTTKVSAYNSEELVDNESTISNNNNTVNTDNSSTKTYTKTVNNGNEYKNKEIAVNYLQNSPVYDTIYRDILNIITISIF